MLNRLKIGELARMTGCQVVTIRYYEREGLLPKPARSDGNYRLYTSEHLEQLHFIRHCRSMEMTLDDIRLLLKFRDTPEESCREVDALLDQHICDVADRITQLKSLESQLRGLRGQCCSARAAKDCRILLSLHSETEGKTQR
ncbi:MAG: Cd(II)/Pb(II)-responsive transcriptional regulator [Acidithiobacillus sp.]